MTRAELANSGAAMPLVRLTRQHKVMRRFNQQRPETGPLPK
jgi:hypothetical protein